MESLETAAFVMQAIVLATIVPFDLKAMTFSSHELPPFWPARRIESSEWDQNSTQAH